MRRGSVEVLFVDLYGLNRWYYFGISVIDKTVHFVPSFVYSFCSFLVKKEHGKYTLSLRFINKKLYLSLAVIVLVKTQSADMLLKWPCKDLKYNEFAFNRLNISS